MDSAVTSIPVQVQNEDKISNSKPSKFNRKKLQVMCALTLGDLAFFSAVSIMATFLRLRTKHFLMTTYCEVSFENQGLTVSRSKSFGWSGSICWSTMLLFHYLALSAYACFLPSFVSAGNQDRDTQIGQVPVKDSPVRSLNNLTVTLIDLSNKKGCEGDNCTSAVESKDETTYVGDENSSEEIDYVRKPYRRGRRRFGSRPRFSGGRRVNYVVDDDEVAIDYVPREQHSHDVVVRKRIRAYHQYRPPPHRIRTRTRVVYVEPEPMPEPVYEHHTRIVQVPRRRHVVHYRYRPAVQRRVVYETERSAEDDGDDERVRTRRRVRTHRRRRPHKKRRVVYLIDANEEDEKNSTTVTEKNSGESRERERGSRSRVTTRKRVVYSDPNSIEDDSNRGSSGRKRVTTTTRKWTSGGGGSGSGEADFSAEGSVGGGGSRSNTVTKTTTTTKESDDHNKAVYAEFLKKTIGLDAGSSAGGRSKGSSEVATATADSHN